MGNNGKTILIEWEVNSMEKAIAIGILVLAGIGASIIISANMSLANLFMLLFG